MTTVPGEQRQCSEEAHTSSEHWENETLRHGSVVQLWFRLLPAACAAVAQLSVPSEEAL